MKRKDAMKQYQSNVNCSSIALTISKASCVLFLGIGVHGAFEMCNMTSCSLDFCQYYMKECLCWDARLFGYSLCSMYLQRCMNIWLMSHGLWRNLITTLQYKASSFTVNTAAKEVSDTKALPGSNECWEIPSLQGKTLFTPQFWTFASSLYSPWFVKIFPVETSCDMWIAERNGSCGCVLLEVDSKARLQIYMSCPLDNKSGTFGVF